MNAYRVKEIMWLVILAILVIIGLAGCGERSTAVVPVAEAPKSEEEGCTAKVISKLVSERNVGQITNLVKEQTAFGYKNQCKVNFDLTVDGQTYHLERTEEGLYQMAVICADARDIARAELLLDLGGVFKSDAEFICRQKDS